MSADVPASHAIFMVVALIAATAVGGAMIGIAFNLADDLQSNSERLSEVMLSDLEIVNDPMEMRYVGGSLYLYALNCGDTSFENDTQWIVIIDGAVVPVAAVTVNNLNGAGAIGPDQVAQLRVDYVLSVGDHSVKVLYGNLAEDRISFRIG
jgi:archaellum component FlaG (FlaF/FlaG flagellin family)